MRFNTPLRIKHLPTRTYLGRETEVERHEREQDERRRAAHCRLRQESALARHAYRLAESSLASPPRPLPSRGAV